MLLKWCGRYDHVFISFNSFMSTPSHVPFFLHFNVRTTPIDMLKLLLSRLFFVIPPFSLVLSILEFNLTEKTSKYNILYCHDCIFKVYSFVLMSWFDSKKSMVWGLKIKFLTQYCTQYYALNLVTIIR